MYYIYCITNKVNDKKYIGSTNEPARRWMEHLQGARLNSMKTYDYPLQRAIRKYGEHNFTFDIIEEVELSIEVPIREREQIIRFNSLTNEGHGYNQTLETDCAFRDKDIIYQNILRTGVKCALVDDKNNILELFDSYHEAAREKLGYSDASTVRDVCDGKCFSAKGLIFRRINDGIIEIPKNQTRKRKQSIVGIHKDDPTNIVLYESISEAARQENIPRASISKCVNGSTRYSCVHNRYWKRSDA